MPSLRAFMDYREFGRFPFGGGIYDQDAQTVVDFRTISALIDKYGPKG